MEEILNNSAAEVNSEKKELNFDFSVLADFCRVRNTGNATRNGNNPPPRVQFLMNLATRLGLQPELDVWTGRRFQNGNDLKDILQFDEDQIEETVESMDHLTIEQKDEEIRVLKIAFEKFKYPIDQLKQELQALENNRNSSKAEKRIYNMMLKFRNDIENTSENNFYNIYIKGTGRVAIMAHHDIVNPNSDNCNDNSASCINVLAAKLLNPEVHVIINDAEEIGGLGADRTAAKIHEGYFGEIDFVLNLELTAVGGKNFFVEKFSESKLFDRITNLFPGVELYSTPFHDGMVLRRRGIDSVVINPLPRLRTGELNYELLFLCHSNDDRISLANYDDMRDFVTDVVTPIIDGRSEIVALNEPTAPLDTVLCSAEGFFNTDNTTIKIVEIDGVKQFELKTVGFSGVEDFTNYPLKLYRYVYSEWKKNKRFNMKVTVDTFNDYTYI